MHIIIPLAGIGSRLRPLTYTTPKPLVQVAGKTVLEHVLDSLQGVPIDDIIFIVGYLGEQIEKYVKNTFPQYRSHFCEQKELNGQSGALALTRDLVSKDLLIIFGDTVVEADLSGLDQIESDGVIFTKEVDDPRRFGVVRMDGPYITRFVEKPKEFVSNQAVGGVYYIKDSQRLFAAIDEQISRQVQLNSEYFLADALQIMVDHGAKLTTRLLSSWFDCGTTQSLLESNRYLLQKTIRISAEQRATSLLQSPSVPGRRDRRVGDRKPPTTDLNDCMLIPPVSIAQSARLNNSIIGPHVSVGENVSITDSRIGPFVSIADSSTVKRSIIQDSILNQSSQIEDAMLTDSLVGNQAHVRGKFDRLIVGDTSEVDSSNNQHSA